MKIISNTINITQIIILGVVINLLDSHTNL